MANNIVTVNVTQTNAPAPSRLQQTGALVSQGGTTVPFQSLSLLTELADLDAIVSAPKAISSISWSLSVFTLTTSAPHGWTMGAEFPVVITGCSPSTFNATVMATVTGTTTLGYVGGDPGTLVTPGTVQTLSAVEITAMATTFFAQGSGLSVYVLELGPGTAAEGVTAIGTFIAANPATVYSYLTPRLWSDEATYQTLLTNYSGTTAKTYFFTTADLNNYTDFSALQKAAFVVVEAPTIPATEFTAAAPFYAWLNGDPSASNKVAPFAFRYLFGVTPYPTVGNAALLQGFKNAGVNYVGTGAEGGISTAILLWGTTMDGNDAIYWYSVDWVQINIDLDLANEIINGSNNPQAPLYYNQDGINRLQARAQSTMNRGISFGLVLPGTGVVDAIAFTTYVADNPSDYAAGAYDGLSTTYTPSRGFISITFNINVSNLPAQ